MRWTVVAMALALAPIFAAGCGDDDDKADKKETAYFGWLLGTKEPAGILVQADAGPDKAGKISAYVCDGLGPPQGKAIWFGGKFDPKAAPTRPVSLTSVSKRETLEIDQVSERLVKGTFTDARGDTHQYMAYPARDGAGIYQVTLDKNLKYTGTSTKGDKVTAQADRKGLVEGRVTTADGEKIPFKIRTLSFSSPANLKSHGLSTSYRKDAKKSLVPGEYVAVVSPSSTHWLGRAGTLKLARTSPRFSTSPVSEIIGLDKKIPPPPGP